MTGLCLVNVELLDHPVHITVGQYLLYINNSYTFDVYMCVCVCVCMHVYICMCVSVCDRH